MTKASSSVRILEDTPAYWRVVFDNPPLNVVDASVFEGLQELLATIDSNPDLRVVVFESANPEFYVAHCDMTGNRAASRKAIGLSGLPIPTGAFVRLTESPIVSIAKIRCRVRGVGSEFVLACDMRFASADRHRPAVREFLRACSSSRWRFTKPLTARCSDLTSM